MQNEMQHTRHVASQSGRYNIYAIIHKSLRLFMSDTLARVGSADANDPRETAQCLAQVRSLIDACTSHLQHENDFIHTAMETRRPGSAQAIAQEHEHHLWALGQLTELAHAVEIAYAEMRAGALSRLYAYLALFIAENFTHMNVEETDHNEVLWATHTDAELAMIEQAIVASLPPEEMALTMRWMIPAMSPAERAEKLAGVRDHAPAPVLGMLLDIARESLSSQDWKKLQRDLGLTEALAA